MLAIGFAVAVVASVAVGFAMAWATLVIPARRKEREAKAALEGYRAGQLAQLNEPRYELGIFPPGRSNNGTR